MDFAPDDEVGGATVFPFDSLKAKFGALPVMANKAAEKVPEINFDRIKAVLT